MNVGSNGLAIHCIYLPLLILHRFERRFIRPGVEKPFSISNSSSQVLQPKRELNAAQL